MSAISVSGLVKRYGDITAVDGLDFTVHTGEVFALLGPNGAGKTTTVEILEGYRTRDEGTVSVLGVDPGSAGREFRDRIGIVLQSSGIDRELTVTEAVDLFGRMYSTQRATGDVLDIVGLVEKADARVKTLSGGQRRRLDLALGIVGEPDLLFLDEPTTGFDPSARRASWRLIDGLRSLGTTILLTTHYMDEAQSLADRVAVMVGGKIVAEGSPDDLGGRATGLVAVRFPIPEGLSPSDLPEPFASADVVEGAMCFDFEDPRSALHDLTGWALDRGVDLGGLTVSRPTLEDVYLDLTREKGADDG